MFVDAESTKERQNTMSLSIQKEMHSLVLRRKMQGKISQEFMDIETVNAKLKKAGYTDTPLTQNELCEVLVVYGVISYNFSLTKPFGNIMAICIQQAGAGSQITNQIHVTTSIQDCEKQKMIWNYNRQFNGTVSSTPGQLIENIMRNASRKMPFVLDTK